MLKYDDKGQADGQESPVSRRIVSIIIPESPVPASAVVCGGESGRCSCQREIEEAMQVRGVRPAVVDTWQEVGGEGQQEGIADDREVCEAR